MIRGPIRATFTITKNKKTDDIDVDKILIPIKNSYGKEKSFKYFIGYDDKDVIKPLFIELPQMIWFVNCFSNAKTMSFKVNEKNF